MFVRTSSIGTKFVLRAPWLNVSPVLDTLQRNIVAEYPHVRYRYAVGAEGYVFVKIVCLSY